MLEKTWQSHNYIKVCIYTKNSQANVSKRWQKKTVGNMYPKIGRNSREHVSKDWLKQSGTCIQKLAKTVGNMYPVVG